MLLKITSAGAEHFVSCRMSYFNMVNKNLSYSPRTDSNRDRVYQYTHLRLDAPSMDILQQLSKLLISCFSDVPVVRFDYPYVSELCVGR